MDIVAPFQMKIVTDIRNLLALLREHGLFCTGRSKRSRRLPHLQRSKPLFETSSLFTLRSPGDHLHVVILRPKHLRGIPRKDCK
jgi:hypothetical protein